MPRIATASADSAQITIVAPNTTFYLSLHTADPGAIGAGEGTDGRKAITFAGSSGGSQPSNSSQSWPSAVGGQTYSYFGVWTLATGGVYIRGGTLTGSITPAAGNVISVAVGAITLTAG